MSLPGVPVPEGLDDSPRVLFWSIDVLVVSSTILFAFALFDHPLIGVILAAIAGWWFERKLGHLSALLTFSHWYLGLAPFKRIPRSYQRYFIG